jgi:hypothetical protein
MSRHTQRNQVGSDVGMERLEGRQLLSGSHAGFGFGRHGAEPVTTIAFSLAPAAVQTGLDALATTDKLTAPTATTTVRLGNANGVETYSVTLTATGTVSRLTVDAAGAPVTAPTQTTTTFAALGTSDAAAAAEISAIATALSLTAPASTATVHVTTPSAGAATYSIVLTATTGWGRGVAVMVDAAGNPVGNQSLPASVIPAAILAGLNSAAPTGATALTATSTQRVRIATADGVTTYSTTFTTTGTRTTVTVNGAGTATSLPSSTTSTFGVAPAAVQAELQSLATADGYSGAIPSTQSTTVYSESNGTTLYGVTLTVTTTTASGTATRTFVVDASGNPTTLPTGTPSTGGIFDGFGGFGGGGRDSVGGFGRRFHRGR